MSDVSSKVSTVAGRKIRFWATAATLLDVDQREHIQVHTEQRTQWISGVAVNTPSVSSTTIRSSKIWIHEYDTGKDKLLTLGHHAFEGLSGHDVLQVWACPERENSGKLYALVNASTERWVYNNENFIVKNLVPRGSFRKGVSYFYWLNFLAMIALFTLSSNMTDNYYSTISSKDVADLGIFAAFFFVFGIIHFIVSLIRDSSRARQFKVSMDRFIEETLDVFDRQKAAQKAKLGESEAPVSVSQNIGNQ